MGLQKHRRSPSAVKRNRFAWKSKIARKTTPLIHPCENCGYQRRLHHVCSNCGYYKVKKTVLTLE